MIVRRLLRVALFCAIASVAHAQVTAGTQGWFPFVISGLDDAPSAADVSFLNEKPAGASGFVQAQGERIVDGAGKPLRWMGVNIVASACFPAKEDAPKIAGHLAKMGVNIIRFHFLDNQWGQIGLLKKPDYTEWDAEAFDRWDFFVSELKKQGIYANINLHVGRTYPGTPKDAPNFSKGLDLFHRPYVDALKDYSRTIFAHVNPYTGKAYKDEPAVGCVEINNENSLALNPWWLLDLKEPFATEIRHLWNTWLGKHVGDTAKLRENFGVSDGKPGPNLIGNPTFTDNLKGWRMDRPDPKFATLTASPSGSGVVWNVLKSGDVAWFHQLNFGGLTLENGKRYRLSFRARAQVSREKVSVSVMQDGGDYKQCGIGGRFDLIPSAMHEYVFDGEVHDALPGKLRVSFNINNHACAYEFDDVRLQLIPTEFLRPEQTLEADNIPLPQRASALPVRRAFMEFLGDVEISYATEIHDYLKRDCGVRVPVAYSQVLFGGAMGARRESRVSDFVDTHGYWQHPHFPNKPWDMKDWEIGNSSQLASKEGGTLVEMAVQRPSGKPYTCSEYDIPAPNDYSVECWPMLTALAAAQDWSGVYIYNYCDDAKHYDTNKIERFFSTLGHPAKQALMPWSALVFRQGLIKPAGSGLRLSLSEGTILDDAAQSAGDMWGSWRRLWQDRAPKPANIFALRTGYALTEGNAVPSLVPMSAFVADPQNVRWDVVKEVFELDAPGAALLLGKLGTHTLERSGLKIDVPSLDGNGHGCIAIVAMDGQSLRESKKILITALRRSENQGMGWDANRKSVGERWGSGPAVVQGLKAKITLPSGSAWKVQALGADGNAKAVIESSATGFNLSPDQQTVWYLGER